MPDSWIGTCLSWKCSSARASLGCGGRAPFLAAAELAQPDPDRICARYWIETAYPFAQAAASMAAEQSTGTFLCVRGETDESLGLV